MQTLTMDYAVKEELKSLLRNKGYVYDDDSNLIWIPEGAEFLPFLEKWPRHSGSTPRP
jgi:hypothetical protein